MTTELDILNGMDQTVPVDDEWILDKVDEIIAESVEKKDAYVALNSCRQLRQISQLSGVALAKFFYLIRENWNEYDIGDDFKDTVYDYVGVHPATVSKYIKIWEMYEKELIPKEFEEQIRQRNIKDQVPISNLVAEDYPMDQDDWEDIVDAPDFTSLSKVTREIRGKKPYKNALLLFISSDGTISATQDEETEFVGYLNVEEAGDIAEKAIQRITRASGILER